MNKAYRRIEWANDEVPINESNLNRMDVALDELDNRIVSMNRTLTNQAESMKQAIEAATTAQEAKEIAVGAADQSKTYMENAEAITGVGIATKDKAGLVKAEDILIEEDGTIRMITSTTSTTMPNSHNGRLLFEEIGGGESQQDSTTGAQLAEKVTVGTDTVLYAAALSIEANLKPNTQYAFSFKGTVGNSYYLNENLFLDWKTFTVVDGVNTFIATTGNDTSSKVILKNQKEQPNQNKFEEVMVNLGNIALPYEPYTGGQPAPSPSFKMEIKSVKGYNLLDCRGLAERTINGVTFTPVYGENGKLRYIEANGIATANAEYSVASTEFLGTINISTCILNGCPNGGSNTSYSLAYLEWTSSWGPLIANYDYGSGVNMSTHENKSISAIRIIVMAGYTAKNLRFYPMIRKASIADSTYVPYGMWGVKTHGKNCLNPSHLSLFNSNRYVSCNYHPVKPNTEYTLSFGVPIGDSSVGVYDDNKTQLASLRIPYNGKTVSFTTPENGVLFGFNALISSDGSLPIEKAECQLEEGTVATVYEPYTESTIALSTELYGIGDVKDVIDVESGKVVRKITENTLPKDGWAFERIDETNSYIEVRHNFPNTEYVDSPTNYLFCTHVGREANDRLIFAYNALYMRIPLSAISTFEDVVRFLANNDVKYLIEYKESITEELPLADQIALNSIKTYDGITYLEFDSEIKPTFKGEYGTSKVGGYTLEGMLAGRNSELLEKSNAERITALEATVVNNI